MAIYTNILLSCYYYLHQKVVISGASVCLFICMVTPKVRKLLIFMWLGPDQSKKCLIFWKDLDHVLDTKTKSFKGPIFMQFQRFWHSGCHDSKREQIFMKFLCVLDLAKGRMITFLDTKKNP